MSADKRASRVSFIEEFPLRSMPRFDPQARRSSVYEWTANAVEKVYSNEVFEIALCMLVANFILVLLMTFPLSHYLLLLRDNMTVLIASRAALVLSFLTLLSLRTYFSYTIDLLALGAVVLVTSFEVSALTSRCGFGLLTFALFLSTLLVVGGNSIAQYANPNLVVLSILVVVNLLLVTNLNFIAAILERKPNVAVDLTIGSLSLSFTTLAIIGFGVIIGDDSDCPFQITDKISSGTILYLLVVYLFATILTLLEIFQNLQ